MNYRDHKIPIKVWWDNWDIVSFKNHLFPAGDLTDRLGVPLEGPPSTASLGGSPSTLSSLGSLDHLPSPSACAPASPPLAAG
jgi:hypothetical protein